MKIVFLGSPPFAVPSLRALHAAGQEVCLVVTRPDRPRGRSGVPTPTAVKAAALELGIPVYQPESVNCAAAREALAGAGAELGVVVAYGELLRPAVLAAVPEGFLNLHASLLPDYRGAAPINWAIMRGETRTGVSVIRVAPQLDAGPILATREVAIGRDETAGELAGRLAQVGAELLADVVGRLAAGEEVDARPQPTEAGFQARRLAKADGRVDWSMAAEEIRNRVRGLTPWPGAYAAFRHRGRTRRVALLRVEATDDAPAGASPGEIVAAGPGGVCVQTGRGVLRVRELKPAGKRAMSAEEFVHGYRVAAGDRFVPPSEGS